MANNWRLGLGRALTTAEGLDELDDPLLSCSCDVEFAAHLDETVVGLVKTFVHLSA